MALSDSCNENEMQCQIYMMNLAAILQFHRFRISGAEWLIGKLPQNQTHTPTNSYIYMSNVHTAEFNDEKKNDEKRETKHQKKEH